MKLKALTREFLWFLGIGVVLIAALAAFALHEREFTSTTGSLVLTLPTPDELAALRFKDGACLRLLRGNHTPQKGNNLILSYQRHDGGNPNIIDDEWYQMLTIEIQNALESETITLPSQRVRLFYSKGASAWVRRCAGKYATQARGTLQLQKSWWGGVRASMELDLDMQPAHDKGAASVEQLRLSGQF